MKFTTSHTLAAVFEQAWAITPQALQTIVQLAQRQDLNIDPKVFHASGMTEPEALLVVGGEPLEGARRAVLRGRSAVIPIVGPIFPRSNLMTLSGATSVDIIGRDLQVALDSDEVDSIILNIDSPGGMVTGTSELSDRIFAARTVKPVYAYVFGTAASGAYWLGSSATEIIGADTARLGSIGVVAAFTDTSVKDEKAGVKEIEIVSSVSPKKMPDPMTDEGRAQIQQMVDDLASVFIGAVARNRGVDESVVLEQFGQGDTIIASKATHAGMADRVGSLEELIQELNTPQKGRKRSKMQTVKQIPRIGVEQLRTQHTATYSTIHETGRRLGAQQAAAGERARIGAILALGKPGDTGIIKMALTPNMTPEEARDELDCARAAARIAVGANIYRGGGRSGIECPQPAHTSAARRSMA